MKQVQVLILGSGPAGNMAATYAGRAGLKPVVLAGIKSPGGALVNTTDIENFSGFPDGISGAELVEHQQLQAQKFGAIYQFDEAKTVQLVDSGEQIVSTELGEQYQAQALIVATGNLYRQLGIPSELEFVGKGVSYCATCDGFFFKDKDVVVVGGGDTAFEEALYLANLCSSITIVHRRNQFRASQIMLQRVQAHPNIQFSRPAVVKEIKGKQVVERIVLELTETSETTELDTQGVFVAIGSDPQTEFLGKQVELDEQGYIKLFANSSSTSVQGVFAAGDVADSSYRQAIIAAGAGARAAIDVERYLSSFLLRTQQENVS